jgi:type I restriction enzyme M protein
LQHVKSCLKIHGRAAIVVPDNVLFEGGAGETIPRDLLKQCDDADRHFLCSGRKSQCVVFRAQAGQRDSVDTKTLWIYDSRTNEHFTLETNPLKRADLGILLPATTRRIVISEKRPTASGRFRTRTC